VSYPTKLNRSQNTTDKKTLVLGPSVEEQI